MEYSREIKDIVQRLAGTHGKDEVIELLCTVNSIQLPDRQCTVTPISGDNNDVKIPNVGLMVNANDGLLLVPTVNSEVMVKFVKQKADFICYVSLYSQLDFIYLVSTLTQFNGGEFGGLIKVIDPNDSTAGILKKLNNLENDINTLKNAFNTWSPVPNDGGAALRVKALTWLGNSLTVTQQADIENKDIIHGAK